MKILKNDRHTGHRKVEAADEISTEVTIGL